MGITINKLANAAGGAGTATIKEEPECEPTVQLPKPDFAQYIPFKPKANAYPGAHPLAGGTFPQPPALAALCATLPPPVCFRGPFVSIEMLFDIFNRIKLTDGKVCFMLCLCYVILFTYYYS